MCPYDTSAKIGKGFYENSATGKLKKISFVIRAPRLFLPKFLQWNCKEEIRNYIGYCFLFR